jgi:hypothetical protein
MLQPELGEEASLAMLRMTRARLLVLLRGDGERRKLVLRLKDIRVDFSCLMRLGCGCKRAPKLLKADHEVVSRNNLEIHRRSERIAVAV